MSKIIAGVSGMLAGAALLGSGYVLHGTTTVTHTVTRTVTRTVTKRVPVTVIRWKTRTVTVQVPQPQQTVPQPQQTLPAGVTSGPRAGTYYVDCFTAQCTSLTGAGPFGTTCSWPPSTGEQLCQ